ncbi:putative disease resistance protein RGA1 [Oryza brachyantha]|uniref:Uncharacterized protein n=1 Tax=Oryza brachyantha TaxID=4533 RepID=J3N0Y8_ORYBR|nr:putative disease resistance protein RGA1 [Oryza brachyantha]
MAEVLLSSFAVSILGKIVSFVSEHSLNENKSDISVHKELRKLQKSLQSINGVLLDAERKQSTSDALKEWLRNLKDVVYDIDDILDDVSTEALKRRVDKGMVTQTKCLHIYRFKLRRKLLRKKILSSRIREVCEKLNEVAIYRKDFGLTDWAMAGQCSEEPQRESYSFVYQADIIGRDDARDEIIREILRASECHDLFVLPLLGLGGIGKTALAKMVYHNQQIRERFCKILWACVSNKFNLKRILQDIIESATGESCKHLNLEQIQKKLRGILQNGNYFLVLDDMWTHNINEWRELRNLLSSGARASVIIVTTRKYVVASMVGTSNPYKVGALPFHECMQIFTRVAFKQGEENKYPSLLKIGESIVKKCAGVPLAIKSLGSLLFTMRDESQWLRVKEDHLCKIIQGDGDIMPVLKLSYNALPPALKPCLSYLSIFPKDFEYYRRCIIMLWMAHGLLRSNNLSDEIDVGNQYIVELIGSSFFQDALITFDGSMPHCKMHDIVHDLGRYVLDTDLAIVNCDGQEVSETVRHLVWDYKDFSHEQEFPGHLIKARKARTFVSSCNPGSLSKKFLQVLLSKFLLLRVLIISGAWIDELPDSIGNLKHLRYVDLTWNKSIKFLPNSICKLINLQTLDLYRCDHLIELPRDVNKLISLRYLSLTCKQKHFPEGGLCGWASLTYLQLHSCSELTSLTEQIGCLTALQMLWISDCPKLPSLPASMKHLSALQELFIENCPELDLMNTEEAMDGLWSLRTLQIIGLPKLERLPVTLCSASRSLQYLLIEKCPKLREILNYMQDLAKDTNHRRVFIKDCPGISRRGMKETDEDLHHPVK